MCTPMVWKEEKIIRQKTDETLKFLDLDSKADLRVDSLPYGDQKRLEIARALAMEPRLLFLDEPVAGLNLQETKEMSHTILKIREKGITVIFAGSSGTKAAKEIENKETIESSGIKIKERCKHPWTNLYITHDGKIGPCNHLMSAPYVLGDLKKGTFRTEWNNKKFQRFRKYNDTILRARVCHWCYQNRYDHF